MNEINFLPWRYSLKLRLRKKAMGIITCCISLAVGIVLMVHYQMIYLKTQQLQRNSRLIGEIKYCTAKIKAVKKIQRTNRIAISRLAKIQHIINQAILVIHLFAEISRNIPNNVQLTKLQKKNSRVILSGNAKSEKALSNLLNIFNTNRWLNHPKLTEIKKSKMGTARRNQFKLSVELKFDNF
jgi:Tfp pilus assembly protein PilN